MTCIAHVQFTADRVMYLCPMQTIRFPSCITSGRSMLIIWSVQVLLGYGTWVEPVDAYIQTHNQKSTQKQYHDRYLVAHGGIIYRGKSDPAKRAIMHTANDFSNLRSIGMWYGSNDPLYKLKLQSVSFWFSLSYLCKSSSLILVLEYLWYPYKLLFPIIFKLND